MRKSTRTKLLITGVVAVLGITFLVYSVLANSGHDKWVNEVAQDPQEWVGQKLRLLGYVQPGSLEAKIEGQHAESTFVLEKDGRRIRVEYAGKVPNTLVDQAEVSAMGHLEQRAGGQLVMVADDVSAKCPSKYEGAHTNIDLAQKPQYQ